jgi:hypothetical protein
MGMATVIHNTMTTIRMMTMVTMAYACTIAPYIWRTMITMTEMHRGIIGSSEEVSVGGWVKFRA